MCAPRFFVETPAWNERRPAVRFDSPLPLRMIKPVGKSVRAVVVGRTSDNCAEQTDARDRAAEPPGRLRQNKRPRNCGGKNAWCRERDSNPHGETPNGF